VATIDRSEVEQKIKEIVANQRRLDPSSLSLDQKLEDLQVESIDLVEIIFAIEDEFDIDVPQDRDAMKLETLGDVVDGVQGLIEKKAA
jgi:acyl carrier protein